MQSNSLQRGKGKIVGNIKRRQFHAFYVKNRKEKELSTNEYKSFLTELLNEFSNAIVTEGLELKIPSVGKIRIKSEKIHLVRKDGTMSKSLRPDWKKTWEYWFSKYEGLSREEIVALEGKKVLFHDNEHTDGEFYQHYWDKHNVQFTNNNCYKFTASRQYSRLLAKTVKDINRKVFYYG
jgi:hypothetical protein